MQDTLYKRLSRLVTVQDLYSRLQVRLTGEMPFAAAIEAINNSDARESTLVSLVYDGDVPIGWVQKVMLEDHDAEATCVREAMCAFDIQTFITASATAWNAVEVFAGRRDEFLFVLDGTKVIGTIFYRDLFKPAFKICLIALTLEFEQRCLQLCTRDADASWLALDPERRKAIRKLYLTKLSKKHQAEPESPEFEDLLEKLDDHLASQPSSALDHSFFRDKREIIEKLGLLPSLSPKFLEMVFDAAQRVRNACVHPESDDEVSFFEDPGDLWSFIDSCHKVLAEIEKLMPAKV